MNREVYQEIVLAHYKKPKFKTPFDPNGATFENLNPACGDLVKLQFEEHSNRLTWRHATQGCAASVASCSIMCDFLNGKTRSESIEAIDKFRMAFSADDAQDDFDPEAIEIHALLQFRDVSARTRCVLLAWDCAYNALAAG